MCGWWGKAGRFQSNRAHFEHEALKAEAAVVPDLVPKIYLFDQVRAAIVMELLEPHIILRKGLIQGIRYPNWPMTSPHLPPKRCFPPLISRCRLAESANSSRCSVSTLNCAE